MLEIKASKKNDAAINGKISEIDCFINKNNETSLKPLRIDEIRYIQAKVVKYKVENNFNVFLNMDLKFIQIPIKTTNREPNHAKPPYSPGIPTNNNILFREKRSNIWKIIYARIKKFIRY